MNLGPIGVLIEYCNAKYLLDDKPELITVIISYEDILKTNTLTIEQLYDDMLCNPTITYNNIYMRDFIKLNNISKSDIENSLDKYTKLLIGITWITQDPGRQWTSIINPSVINPEQFYGKYYSGSILVLNLKLKH